MNLSNLHANKRTPEGFAKAVKMIGCEPEALRAVMAVEARNRGYDRRGRLVALFEPHWFYRLLQKHEPDKLAAAVSQGLAYQNWRPGAYPRDSYQRIIAAMAIDEELALQSTSWGLPQILGVNHELAGYASAQEMVEDFLCGEDPQFLAMARFIVGRRLDAALRARDWDAFAYGYNGKGYRANAYHTRLADAYAREKRRTNTNSAINGGAVIIATTGAGNAVNEVSKGGEVADGGGFTILSFVAAVAVYFFNRWRNSVIDSKEQEPEIEPAPVEGEEESDTPVPQITASPTSGLDAARARLKTARDEYLLAAQAVDAERRKLAAQLEELRNATEAAMVEVRSVSESVSGVGEKEPAIIDLPDITGILRDDAAQAD